jgi:hypothetical protein
MKAGSVVQGVKGLVSAVLVSSLIGCASTQYDRSTGEVLDDKALGRRVHAALSDQPVYKFPDVHVHTYRGVVQLSGFVASQAQKEAATEIAQGVRGVAEVQNAIALAPLARGTRQDFIPGRENETNTVSVGRPDLSTGVTTGSFTNSVRTNRIDTRY